MREHAKPGGFREIRVSEVRQVIDPDHGRGLQATIAILRPATASRWSVAIFTKKSPGQT